MSPIVGGGLSVPSVTFHVSAAEVLALHTSPKQVVAAPGVGKVLLPISGVLVYTFGGTPYTVGTCNLQLTTPLGAADGFASLLELSGAQNLLGGSSDGVSAWAPNSASDISSGFGGDWTLAKWTNAPMVLYLSDTPTGGNSTFDMTVIYQVLVVP